MVLYVETCIYMWKSVFFSSSLRYCNKRCSLSLQSFILSVYSIVVFFFDVCCFVLFLARKQCIPKYFKTVKKALWLYHFKIIPCVLVASLK